MVVSTRDCGLILAGVAAGAGLVAAVHAYGGDSGASVDPGPKTAARTRLAANKTGDPAILQEQLSRNTLFLGAAGQAKVASAFVVVIGAGGVGSHAAHMLARSGVSRLRLIDFDQVSVSSLNRHAVATRDDVGRSKVQVCAERFKDFAPDCRVEAIDAMFAADVAETLLAGAPDYVIDCIDDVETKADLLQACQARNIAVLSALGAGGKSDPTRVLIGEMADPVKDPLAMKLRKTLYWRAEARAKRAAEAADEAATTAAGGSKPEGAVDGCTSATSTKGKEKGRSTGRSVKGADPADGYLRGIHVVYSYEKTCAKLGELTDEQVAEPAAFGAVANFRLGTMPVLGHMPAIFGMMAAGFVVCQLAERPFEPKQVELITPTFRVKLHDRLVQRERKSFGNLVGKPGATPIADQAEVTYVVEDVWHTRSCFNNSRAEYKGLALTRFDRSKPALPYNLVLLEPKEATAHDEQTASTGCLPADILTRPHLIAVQKRLLALEKMWVDGPLKDG